MNSTFKPLSLLVVLGMAFIASPAFAETNSSAGSTSSARNSKTSAKSADQSNAKNSGTPTRTDTVKDSTLAHPVEPSAVSKEDSTSSDPVAAPRGPVLFKLLDTDKDGRISSAEFIAYGKADEGHSNEPAKSLPVDQARSDSPKGSTPRNAGALSDLAKTAHSDDRPAALPKPVSPGAGILSSTNTRAGKYTAEVFEILDINHDKFLTQAELDALIPAHQISQP